MHDYLMGLDDGRQIVIADLTDLEISLLLAEPERLRSPNGVDMQAVRERLQIEALARAMGIGPCK